MEKPRFLNLFKIASGLAIIGWALMMGALFKKTYISPLSHKIGWGERVGEELRLGESWMGIYLHDRKIGYSVTSWEREGQDLRVVERTIMELMVMGQPQKVNVSTNCLLDPALYLKSFRFHLSSEQVSFQAEGEIEEKRMRVRLSGIGQREEIEIPLKQIPFLWSNLRFLFKNRDLFEGQRLQVSLFDPATLNMENLLVQVEGRERLRIGTHEVEALKLKQTFKGTTIHSWIGEGGEILKEESPLGFTLVKEEKEAAILRGRGKGRAEDLIALSAVPSNLKIPDPQAVRILRIGLGDFPRDGLDLEGGRQRLRGHSLEIRREALNFQAPHLPFRSPSLEPYLLPTPFIQSDHPEMRQMASSILRDERNSLAAARKLASWVFENIEKRPVLSIPSALEVLHRRVGDCNEHTILFVGLARAAGIPTKVNSGLVYAKDNFYYHAWAEVFVGQWIAIDPTLNQFPADATHIRLIEGGLERQAELVRLMGEVSLEILGFQ